MPLSSVHTASFPPGSGCGSLHERACWSPTHRATVPSRVSARTLIHWLWASPKIRQAGSRARTCPFRVRSISFFSLYMLQVERLCHQSATSLPEKGVPRYGLRRDTPRAGPFSAAPLPSRERRGPPRQLSEAELGLGVPGESSRWVTFGHGASARQRRGLPGPVPCHGVGSDRLPPQHRRLRASPYPHRLQVAGPADGCML